MKVVIVWIRIMLYTYWGHKAMSYDLVHVCQVYWKRRQGDYCAALTIVFYPIKHTVDLQLYVAQWTKVYTMYHKVMCSNTAFIHKSNCKMVNCFLNFHVCLQAKETVCVGVGRCQVCLCTALLNNNLINRLK